MNKIVSKRAISDTRRMGKNKKKMPQNHPFRSIFTVGGVYFSDFTPKSRGGSYFGGSSFLYFFLLKIGKGIQLGGLVFVGV